MDRPAGTVKPIHRDMTGIIHIMTLLEVSISELLLSWFMALVARETFMDRKEATTDTRGSRNSPMEPQLMPSAQNFQLGTIARLMPRKSVSSTKILVESTSCWREARFSLLMREIRYSSLKPPCWNTVLMEPSATLAARAAICLAVTQPLATATFSQSRAMAICSIWSLDRSMK